MNGIRPKKIVLYHSQQKKDQYAAKKRAAIKSCMEVAIKWDINLMLHIFDPHDRSCSKFSTLPVRTLLEKYANFPEEEIQTFVPTIEINEDFNSEFINPQIYTPSAHEEFESFSRTIIGRRK